MQRLIARLLLLVALAGNLLPLALAATAAPVPACCRRMGAHHCNTSTDSGQISFRNRDCCNHDCCRAVTISQIAHPESPAGTFSGQAVRIRRPELHHSIALAQPTSSQSTRAPPQIVLA